MTRRPQRTQSSSRGPSAVRATWIASLLAATGLAAAAFAQAQPAPDEGQPPEQPAQPVQPGVQPGSQPPAQPVSPRRRGGTPTGNTPFNPAQRSANVQPGVAQPVAAQPGAPAGESPTARQLRERNEQLQREREEIQRQLRDGLPPGGVPAQNIRGGAANPALLNPGMVAVPDEADPANPPAIVLGADGRPVPAGAAEHLQGDGQVRLNFGSEPIEMGAFIDYVSLVLGVNIIPDEAVVAQRFVLRAPMEVPQDQLLPLLSAIVESKGFALHEDPLLGYIIVQAANVPVGVGEGELSTTRIVRTPLVRPSALQPTITASLGGQGGNVRLSPFDDLGVMVMTGTPRQLTAVEGLIERIMGEVREQKLVRFDLNFVNASHARERVLTLNGRLGGGAGGLLGAGTPQAPAAPGGSLVNLENRLVIDSGNGLVFRGTAEESEMVADLVALVDTLSPLESKRYAAGSVAMDIAMAGEREGLGPVEQTQGGGGSVGFGGGFSTGGRAGGVLGAGQQSEGRVNTSGFTVDIETGSIIYQGTDAQHARVAELVRTFTEQIQGKRIEIKMYKLQNATAESVSEILNELVAESGSRTGTSPLVPGSRQQGLRQARTTRDPNLDAQAATLEGADTAEVATGGEGDSAGGVALTVDPEEVSIVPDVDRNQVVIKAPARQQAEFERIIRDLDVRQPQVYIEAQIVSVTTSDDFNWTVETQINAGQFLLFSNFGLSTAGAAAGGNQAAQAPRIVGTGNRGLTSAIIKSDYVPIILNTLQSQTKAKIQSRPRILVNDNQEGTISSQREEPFATTTQGTATTTTGQGGVAEAGTVLTVTPRISGGGYISLEYAIELSSFVGNPSSGLQPPKQKENYESSVTVPSDSTIIVGGFTLASESESESGIPILKDIPLIGALFKSYGSTNRRTTIFVFITPTIMTDPNFIDLRLATEGPMKRMGVENDTPDLESIRIPIRESDVGSSRRVPQNLAPDLLEQSEPTNLDDAPPELEPARSELPTRSKLQ